MNKINQKHQSIAFDLKFLKENIEFLDKLAYINSNNRLHTTLYKKPTDSQNYLHATSVHSLSLKKGFLKARHLELKNLTFEENRKHSQDLIKTFPEKGYN